MRPLLYATTVLAALAGPALAQGPAVPVTPQGVPPGANPETGARPGNEIGTKSSLPAGNRASNINEENKRSDIAPNLPTPRAGDDASASQYLQDAQTSLNQGRTGEAQEALERAQTRLLEDQQAGKSSGDLIQRISDARQALGSHDQARAEELISGALNTQR
jgi:hypothetical protein